jgi:hypothetical protein
MSTTDALTYSTLSYCKISIRINRLLDACPSKPVSKVDVHSLDVCISTFIVSDLPSISAVHDILAERVLSILSSKPRLLVSSERHIARGQRTRVNPNRPCLQFVRGFNGPIDILAENICGKTIYCVICFLDNIFIMMVR